MESRRSKHPHWTGLWIHLDADILHDSVMPAVDYRMPDGLLAGELSEPLGVVLASPAVVGMQVTIYNPTFDEAHRSAARAPADCISAGPSPARGSLA